jgi:hypothetical protein
MPIRLSQSWSFPTIGETGDIQHDQIIKQIWQLGYSGNLLNN